MKTTAKGLTIMSILLIGSMGLVGQKSLMAYSSDIKYDVELSAGYASSIYQFYMEDKIDLKNWMISADQWDAVGQTRLTSAMGLENEADIDMEDWMVQPFMPEKTRLSELVKEDEGFKERIKARRG